MVQTNDGWETLARRDPLHAVASERGKRGRWREPDFLAKGREYVDLTRRGWKAIAPNSVLEVGCGAGRVTSALAAEFESVVALDVSPTMLDEAKRLVHADNVEFVQGDGLNLPDGPFDVVYSTQVLQHIDRATLPALFKEIARVLKGRAVLHIPQPTPSATTADITRLVPVRRGVTKVAKALGLSFDYGKRPWIVTHYNRYTSSQVRKMAAEAGLRLIEQFEFRPGKPESTVYVFNKPGVPFIPHRERSRKR